VRFAGSSSTVRLIICASCVCGSAHAGRAFAQQPGVETAARLREPTRAIRIIDPRGDAVAGASWVLRSAQGAVLQQGETDAAGAATIAGFPRGAYWLEVAASPFQPRRVALEVDGEQTPPMEIRLELAGFQSEVTVTTLPGVVSEVDKTPAVVNVRDGDDFRRRSFATLGNVLEGATGVMVQQSTYGQVSPFLRGLTGYQVLNLIDGVRFNNSTFRSGPNQYLAFIDSSQAQRIEAMLGPASSQFGSDALGGTIQLLTPSPQFADAARLMVRANASVFGATADESGGGEATAILAGKRFTGSAGASWRQLSDLRGGSGRDSHHVLRRLAGLSDAQIDGVTGADQLDTGFSQSGVHTKSTVRLGHDQNLTVLYQQGEQRDVRGYKDLWGGLGRLRSDFAPQRQQLFYTRYETFEVAKLDWLRSTLSINSQRDGSIRQGLRTTDPVVQDDVEVDAYGYVVTGGAHVSNRQSLVFGAELYDEDVDARRDQTDPSTGVVQQKRPLYPDGSRYRTIGLFVQSSADIVRGAEEGGIKAQVGGRFTRIDAEMFAARNPGLGVVDASQSYQDWTFNAGMVWAAARGFSLSGLIGRGFRAPNLNDLGALGLNDLGYEIPAEATLDTGSFIGASDGEGAASSGRPVEKLRAERLFNYEIGASLRWRTVYARANAFDAELKDPIVRRSLVFDADQVPAALAGVAVVPIPPSAAQRTQNVVSVATALDPRAVKAFVNDGAARYYGLDALVGYCVSDRWFAEANYSYLVGRDLHPSRPVRRLPPQQGLMSLRFQPGGRLTWIGVSALLSGAQRSLSGGDLTDERIGAARSRTDILDFFQGGLIRPYLLPGSDARFGTSDDVFTPSGETAAHIRDRVLPLGATINGVTVADDRTRVPLYRESPAFASLTCEAGITLTPHLKLNLAVANLLDRSYRIHGSGVDAPGVNAYVRLTASY
jgi:hemoglobin/transferrin/lactoferrin receptor protein